MYALLSGRHVHDAESASETLVRAATRPATALREVAPEVPEALCAVVDRALAFAKAERWADAAAMKEALRKAYGEAFGHEPEADEELSVRPVVVEDEASWASVPERPVESPASPTNEGVSATRDAGAGFTEPLVGLQKLPTRTMAPTGGVGLRAVRVAAVVLAGIAVASVVGIWRFRGHGPEATRATGDAGTAVAVAQSRSSNPQAQALYEAGLRLNHDARVDSAVEKFEQALALDPSFAAAHVQIAAITTGDASNRARSHFNEAVRMRALLSEDEQSLLDAIAPAHSVPTDWRGALARLIARSDARPSDSSAAALAASVALSIGDYPSAISLSSRAVERDASNATALQIRGMAFFYSGRMEEARTALAACTEAVPEATDCIAALDDADAYTGRCADAERGSRRLIALEPNNSLWHEYLARAIYGEDGDLETARAVLASAEERTSPGMSLDTVRHRHAFGLATLSGDLHTAERELREWDRSESGDLSELTHAPLAADLVALHIEDGDRAGAAEVARDFLKQRKAWIASRAYDLEAVGWQGLYAADAASKADLARARERSFAKSPKRLWDIGYLGTPIKTLADAQEILDHRPDELWFLTKVRDEDAYGNALRVAGHLDEAMPMLELAAHNCRALFFPIEHTRANLHLGLALEAKGDHDGACAAFATVVKRWGKVRGSETARTALAHAATLRCSADAGQR
jgi:serine/threonine-protein kinase